MQQFEQIHEPVTGRTYSLYGSNRTTTHFYEQISDLIDSCLNLIPNKAELLKILQRASKSPDYLQKGLRKNRNSKLFEILSSLKSYLNIYITDLDYHLESLSFRNRFDKVLSTEEFQYYLNMLEVELVNRIFKDDFIKSEKKIALLPHCLRDLNRKCMSEPSGMDYICKACSKNCYVNFASKILKEHSIEPYIWLTASQRKLFKQETDGKKNLGVLGIACIPELIRGMRMCMRKKIPVVGIPLDANRCARWMGEFHTNTVNLQKLKELIS